MKQAAGLIAVLMVLISCTGTGTKKEERKNNWISLRSDSVSVVRLTDTLVIHESICRGCEYEGSVKFSIRDSLEMIKLLDVITNDGDSPDVAGGSVSKEIVLVPLRPGSTAIKLYKILAPKTAREDSARFSVYSIEVKTK